jgi:spermidine synthase
MGKRRSPLKRAARPERWREWLSHFLEQHVESASSPHNPHLYVSLKQGRYQLSTANAVYSYADLYTNYRRAFRAIDLHSLPIREVLVLGLGLGSIPLMLEKIFRKNYRYTAVEIDEAVLELAAKYGLGELRSGIELHCADAAAFARQCRDTFDLICMDIFLDDVVPPVFEQVDFLLDLRRLLNPKGLLLYNRLAATSQDRRASRLFFENTFLQVFPEGTYLDVGGNWMLMNGGRK